MQYNEDMKKFRKLALASQEYGSTGHYSNPTSEYGLNPSVSSSEGQQTREMEMRRIKNDSNGFSDGTWQQAIEVERCFARVSCIRVFSS